MPWLQISFVTDRERAPLIEAALESAGALAVTLGDAADEAQLEPAPGSTPLWSRVQITALFADDADARSRADALTGTLPPDLAATVCLERIEDQVWERAWMKDFVPTRFGRRLWVCPRGQAPSTADAVVVELDPGLAFGTGHHPTTALCLEWLDGVDLDGASMIDYGCGSGILAIAALRLGAARAVAVDHDPQALEATHENARVNAVADRLTICSPDSLPLVKADILIANILAGPLVELAPRLSALVTPGGHLALSGILTEQADEVARAYHPRCAMDPPLLRDEWVLLSGRGRMGDARIPPAQEGPQRCP